MYKLSKANLQSFGNAVSKYPNTFQKMKYELPSYRIRFNFEKFTGNEAIENIKIFGINNFRYLENKINSFQKTWTFFDNNDFLPENEVNFNDKKRNKLFKLLIESFPSYEFNLPKNDFFHKPVHERETRDLSKIMNFEYLSQTPKLIYGRISIPFEEKYLIVDTIDNNVSIDPIDVIKKQKERLLRFIH